MQLPQRISFIHMLELYTLAIAIAFLSLVEIKSFAGRDWFKSGTVALGEIERDSEM